MYTVNTFQGTLPAHKAPASLTHSHSYGVLAAVFSVYNPSPDTPHWTRSGHLIQLDQSDSFSQESGTLGKRERSQSPVGSWE